ncbi:MAG: MarR family winged helix-turn-helix transcriptional regulator [Bacillota bacterium]
MSEIKKGSQIALLIREINHLIKENVRNVFKDSGVTMPQMMVIGMLFKHKRLKVSALSKKMNLANSTVSGIVDRLEKMDMVRRVRSEEDKRVVYIELSEKTEDIHTRFHNMMNDYLEGTLCDASDEQLNSILNGLETLKDLLVK